MGEGRRRVKRGKVVGFREGGNLLHLFLLIWTFLVARGEGDRMQRGSSKGG